MLPLMDAHDVKVAQELDEGEQVRSMVLQDVDSVLHGSILQIQALKQQNYTRCDCKAKTTCMACMVWEARFNKRAKRSAVGI